MQSSVLSPLRVQVGELAVMSLVALSDADEVDDDWGYRRLDTYGGTAGFRRPGAAPALAWLAEDVTISGALGSPETTAGVRAALSEITPPPSHSEDRFLTRSGTGAIVVRVPEVFPRV